jgi:hypothetical protein
VNKIIVGLLSLCLLCGGLIIWLRPKPPAPVKISAKEKVAEKKELRKIKRTFTPDGKVASEEIDEFLSTRKSSNVVDIKPELTKKDFLLGVTLGYDFDKTKIIYNLVLGKAVFNDLYVIGKVNTDWKKAEAGIIWVH